MATIIEQNLTASSKAGHPVARIVTLNAELARDLLRRNTRNRDVRKGRVERYRDDMSHSRWTLNGQAIIVASDGSLVDGQHRAMAIEPTDMEVPILLVTGVDPDAAVTVDQGLNRTAGDYLRLEGIENGATCASIVRNYLAYERNDGTALSDTARVTNAHILAWFEQNGDEVIISADIVLKMRDTAAAMVSPSVLGFCHLLLARRDRTLADRYVTQVGRGEDIHEGDPAFAVRTRLLNMGKTGAAKKAGVILTGWNAFVEGRSLRTVRVPERLPPVVTPKPPPPPASADPPPT